MEQTRHFHTIAGDRDYPPDYNEAFDTFEQAYDSLIDYVAVSCSHNGSNPVDEHGICTDTVEISPETRFLEFTGNTHGVEYIEITDDCNKSCSLYVDLSDCLEEEETQ